MRKLERKLQEEAAERQANGAPPGSFSQNGFDVDHKLVILEIGVAILILTLAMLSLTSTPTPGTGPWFQIAHQHGGIAQLKSTQRR